MKEQIKRLFDLLPYIGRNYPKEIFLAGKANGIWKAYSTDNYLMAVRCFSLSLLEEGFKAGDKIVSVCSNSPEWNIIDMGIMQIGAIHVPLYNNLPTTEYETVIRYCDVSAVIVDTMNGREALGLALKDSPSVKLLLIGDLLGREFPEEEANESLNEIKEKIEPSDPATMIYTSGTSGQPQCVVLSHANIVENVLATVDRDRLNQRHKVLSCLPLCHIYERILNYHYQYKGISIYYSENFGTVINDLNEIHAEGFAVVPQFLEKVFHQIVASGKDLPLAKKKFFFWAVRLALAYEPFKPKNRKTAMKYRLADKLVFRHWRKALGGKVKMIVSGGTALQSCLIRVFWAAGMPVQEGYGLSEAPVVAVNGYRDEDLRIGTVGRPLKNIEVLIAEDGEILCRGNGVARSYYRGSDSYGEDGWFHTGDIGSIDQGFLKFLDRKDAAFRLSSGEIIFPRMVEEKLKLSGFIEQVAIVGRKEKKIAAIICPNFDYLHFWATKHHLKYRDNAELITLPELNARIQKEINKANELLMPCERVAMFRMVNDEWSFVTGELSSSLKLRREVILTKYHDLLEKIYGHAIDQTEEERNLASRIKF